MGEKKIEKFESFVDTKTLMEKYGFGRNFWTDARNKRDLPHFKIGNKIKYRLSEVESWLKERKVNG